MNIPKPTEDDKAFFHSLVPEDVRVVVKPMFGNLAGFVNGNMFMGLFGPDVGLRLAPGERETLFEIAGAGSFGPDDRPMKEYVAIPADWRQSPAQAEEWVEAALEHTAAMPPKVKKKR